MIAIFLISTPNYYHAATEGKLNVEESYYHIEEC